MGKHMRITAALLAAITALTAAGCGETEEKSPPAAAVTESAATAVETATAAQSITAAADGERSFGNTTVSVKGGFDETVHFMPSAEDIDRLVKLALRQYNAIIERDAESYLNTLNLRKQFDGVDKEALFNRLLRENTGQQAYCQVMTGGYILPADIAFTDHLDEMTADAEKHTKLIIAAFDEIDSDFLTKMTNENKSDELSCSYFTGYNELYDELGNPQGKMVGGEFVEREVKTLGENTVCTARLMYTDEVDGGQYAEFELLADDGGYKTEIGRVDGWIKNGECGVNISLLGSTIRDLSDFSYTVKPGYEDNIKYQPSKAEMDRFSQLAYTQYKMIFCSAAEEYLQTLNAQELFEGVDIAQMTKELAENSEPGAFDLVMKSYLGAIEDPMLIMHGIVVDEEDPYESIPAEIGRGIGELNADFLENTDRTGEYLKGSYFTEAAPYYNKDTNMIEYGPIYGSAAGRTELMYSEERGGVIYVEFGLTLDIDGKIVEIGKADAWKRGGADGVYISMIGKKTEGR